MVLMISQIAKWLKDSMNEHVDVLPEHFAHQIRDGSLIARILQHYGVIDYKEMQNIEETSDPEMAYENFMKYLVEWLVRIGICLSETDVLEITEGTSTAGVSLLYEMYIELFVKHVENVETPDHRHFAVNRVNETFNILIEPNPMCAIMGHQWDLISWEKDHLAALKLKYLMARKDYDEYLKAKQEKKFDYDKVCAQMKDGPSCDIIAGNNNDEDDEIAPYSYDDLVIEQNRALQLPEFQPNPKLAKKMIRSMRKKRQLQEERDAVKVELQRELLSQVWNELMKHEEVIFDKTLAHKLERQSKCEKAIAKKLLEVRLKRDVMLEHRRQQDEELARTRDVEFIRALFEDHLDAQLSFHVERQKAITLHRKLYEEKMRLKNLRHGKLCQDVMRDIVDMAMKAAEYNKMYGQPPSRTLERQWAELFVKQQPIFDLVVPVEDIKKKLEELPEVIEEIYIKEAERQDVLDAKDFSDYHEFLDIWEWHMEDDVTHKIDCAMNVIGYYVHKYLLKKYPHPLPKKPHLAEEIEVAVCAINIKDKKKLIYLQRLLNERQIKVMEMEDAVNYCIEAFETESKVEFDETLPDDIDGLQVIEPSADKKKEGKDKKGKGKKDKKDKGSKKSDKKSKDSKKDKKGKKGKGKAEEEPPPPPPPPPEHKVVQTPRLFPWEQIILTPKAELGKLAKEYDLTGKQLPDRLLCAMLSEYLSSLKDIKGWVLCNYPNTFDQAACLEQALSGKLVPKDYYEEIANKQSLESIVIAEEEKEEIEDEEEERKPVAVVALETIQSETSNSISTQQRENSEPEFPSQTNPEVVEFIYDDIGSEDIKEHQPHNVVLEGFTKLVLGDLPEEIQEPSLDQIKGQLHLPKVNSKNCTCHDQPAKASDNGSESLVESVNLDLPPEYVENPAHAEPHNTATGTEDGDCEDVGTDMIDMKDCCDRVKHLDPPKFLSEKTQTSPKHSIISRENIRGALDDGPDEALRRSKLVPNSKVVEPYDTVLTGYIKLVPKPAEEEPLLMEEDVMPFFKELEKIDGLTKFYCDQGCFYVLEHDDEVTWDTVKILAKLIIGDYSLPLKTSVELFGEKYKEAMLEEEDHTITKTGKEEGQKKKGKQDKKKGAKDKGEKAEKGKKGKKDKKGKKEKSKSDKKSKKSDKTSKGKKGKKGKKDKDDDDQPPPKTFEDKEVQFPEVEIPPVDDYEPRAGEPGWQYADLPVPSQIELILANMWENLEKNYIDSFKAMFFSKRVLLNAIMPYIAHVRHAIEEYIARPDQKQHYLREFQKHFNEIDLELRNDEETKTEILCQIKDFRDKLYNICDHKMRESEEERCRVIRQSWVPKQIFEITANSAQAFQFELDRFADTVKFLTDHFCATITKLMITEPEWDKARVNKMTLSQDVPDLFIDFLINIDKEIPSNINSQVVENVHELALAFVKKTHEDAMNRLEKMQKLFLPKPKAKKSKKKGKDGGDILAAIELDIDVIENAGNIFEEWQCALNGESERVQQRFALIKKEMFKRIEEIARWSKDVFKETHEKISQRYDNEMKSVTKACEILARAVAEEKVILDDLVFDNDKLAAIKVKLFPEVPPTEDYKDSAFTVQQLDYMVKVLFSLAPDGYIMDKTFLLLVQDMIFQIEPEEEGEEIELPKYSPSIWRHLSTQGLEKLFARLFDYNEYIQWKDFIVCNLILPFPDRNELMELRKQFRSLDKRMTEVVSKEQFDSVRFWFEETRRDNETLRSIIFRLYETEDHKFNYTAMLLDFCRADDPILGFVKALEMSLGKTICCEKELGKKYVEEIMYQRYVDEEIERVRQEMELAMQGEDDSDFAKLRDLFNAEEEREFLDYQSEDAFSDEIGETDKDENVVENVIDNYKIEMPSDDEEAEEEQIEESFFYSDDKFSNIEIGFESRDNTQVAHFLPFELLQIVIITCLPWHSRVEGHEEMSFLDEVWLVYESCKNDDFNGAVLAHEFLNDERILAMFKGISKFSAHNPVKMVKEIIEEEKEIPHDEEETTMSDINIKGIWGRKET